MCQVSRREKKQLISRWSFTEILVRKNTFLTSVSKQNLTGLLWRFSVPNLLLKVSCYLFISLLRSHNEPHPVQEQETQNCFLCIVQSPSLWWTHSHLYFCIPSFSLVSCFSVCHGSCFLPFTRPSAISNPSKSQAKCSVKWLRSFLNRWSLQPPSTNPSACKPIFNHLFLFLSFHS